MTCSLAMPSRKASSLSSASSGCKPSVRYPSAQLDARAKGSLRRSSATSVRSATANLEPSGPRRSVAAATPRQTPKPPPHSIPLYCRSAISSARPGRLPDMTASLSTFLRSAMICPEATAPSRAICRFQSCASRDHRRAPALQHEVSSELRHNDAFFLLPVTLLPAICCLHQTFVTGFTVFEEVRAVVFVHLRDSSSSRHSRQECRWPETDSP